MSTLALSASGDLDVDGGLTLTTDLLTETAQRLRIKFRFFLGEWLLDTRAGMPLFEKVLVKAPNLSELQRLYRSVIAGDPAVDQVNALSLDLDTPTRTLSLFFEATLNDGSKLTFEDFVLEENL